LKSIKYYYGKPIEDVLIVFDDYSRVRLNEQEIDELDKKIQEIKQLFCKENNERIILNQESVLKGSRDSVI
jgi:hypothetical protein